MQTVGLTSTFLRYRLVLKTLVGKIVQSKDVDDIISETYLKTYEQFGDSEIDFPKAYLCRTARNLALNHIARHENRFTKSIEDIANSDVYLASEEFDDEFEALEKFQCFCVAVENLPPKCRKAFLLKRVYNWSMKAIAKEMGITVSTVEKHISRGLMTCANSLHEHGYDLTGYPSSQTKKTVVQRK